MGKGAKGFCSYKLAQKVFEARALFAISDYFYGVVSSSFKKSAFFILQAIRALREQKRSVVK